MKNKVKIYQKHDKGFKEGKYIAAMKLIKELSDHEFASLFDIEYEIPVKGDICINASFSKTIQDWKFKNLKKIIEEFQSEAKSRIVKGEFEVVNTIVSYTEYYIGNIEIKIDDLFFKFSISKSNYVSEHGKFNLFADGISVEEFEALKKAYTDHTKTDRDNQIKELQEKIAELEKI